MKDLVILAADVDLEFMLRGLLARPADLGIRPVSADIYRHIHHDPGCLTDSHNMLRTALRTHARALVVFDREGCGREAVPREQLEERVERLLAQNGWGDRAAAVVIDPELEQLVWSDSKEVDRIVGWAGRVPDLRSCLLERGLLQAGQLKPSRPKEALAHALRLVRKQPSASLFERLAREVPLEPCTDAAFAKLRNVLIAWFAG